MSASGSHVVRFSPPGDAGESLGYKGSCRSLSLALSLSRADAISGFLDLWAQRQGERGGGEREDKRRIQLAVLKSLEREWLRPGYAGTSLLMSFHQSFLHPDPRPSSPHLLCAGMIYMALTHFCSICHHFTARVCLWQEQGRNIVFISRGICRDGGSHAAQMASLDGNMIDTCC